MGPSKTKKVVAIVVAAGTLGVAGSTGVVSAAEDGAPGPEKPGAVAAWHREGRHLRLRIVRGALRVSAETVRVPVKELLGGLRSGQTVEQFAQSKGVEPAIVEAALEQAAKVAIEAAAARGAVGEQLAQRLSAALPKRVDQFMTRSWSRLAQAQRPSS